MPLWGQKTSTAILRESGVAEESIPKERLLVVDLSAPVTILKMQFLASLERAAKQKIAAGPGYADWEDHGVLPFIDLELWRDCCYRGTIRQRVLPRIIYSDSLHFTAKNLRETTLPQVRRMLDTTSPAFCALKSAASSEFAAGIASALSPDDDSGSAASEAPTRWLPRTYPYDVPRLTRILRLFPNDSAAQKEILDSLEEEGELRLSVAERIRKNAQSPDDENGRSQVWREISSAIREA